MHRSARPAEQLSDEGGAGGLAVRAGDAIHRAGAERQEKLQFAGDGYAPAAGFGEFGGVVLHAGGAEEDLLRDIGEIVRPEHEANPYLLQLLAEIAQLGQAAAVSDGEPGPGGGILADQFPVADPHPDQADGPGFYHGMILFQCQFHWKRFLSCGVKIGKNLLPCYCIPGAAKKIPVPDGSGAFFCGGYRRDTPIIIVPAGDGNLFPGPDRQTALFQLRNRAVGWVSGGICR